MKSTVSLPVSGVLRETSKVERYEKDYKEMKATGYVVLLTDVTIMSKSSLVMEDRANEQESWNAGRDW